MLLVLLAIPWLGVFVIALYLDPYQDGRVWQLETHRQLGLPPCTFRILTDLPCPSCGMSTAFALLVRGDVWNSIQANFVGTLLALFGLAYVPWSVYSACRGRLVGIRSLEHVVVFLTLGFVGILFMRWIVVLLLHLAGVMVS